LSEGKSASLKKGPFEVPPLIKRHGTAVCALFFIGSSVFDGETSRDWNFLRFSIHCR